MPLPKKIEKPLPLSLINYNNIIMETLIGQAESSDYFGPILDWTVFVVLTLVEGFVFFKLRFRLDISGLLTLILHYVVSVLRIINHYQPFNSPFQIFINLLGSHLIWFSFYYFTIEMKLTQSLLTDQPKAYLIKKTRLTYLKCFSGMLIVIYCIIFAIVLSTVFEKRD